MKVENKIRNLKQTVKYVHQIGVGSVQIVEYESLKQNMKSENRIQKLEVGISFEINNFISKFFKLGPLK